MRIIVIGAGIFGVTIALELSKRYDVTLVDANSDILQNASKVNHSRLHFGFHYPRSEATARQCLESYELFYDYFSDAITAGFGNYYMIEKASHVTSRYYEQFCDNLGLKYKAQFPCLDMDFSNIETSYLTNEPIFDYDLIKNRLAGDLKKSSVKLILNKRITSKKELKEYDVIVNTTYFNINKINAILGLPQPKLRLQTVIIPIFKWNREKIGITIMDGKFCSVMPKGFNRDTFLLYHAGESVIYEVESEIIPDSWYYGKKLMDRFRGVYDKTFGQYSINKIRDASMKYFLFLKRCDFVDYWQTVRALPVNDNDERLSIVTVTEKDSQKIISVLSGKISTCLLTAKNIKL